MTASKVLVVGSANGQIEKLFQKISKLHSKQNFSFAIAIGDLFAAETSAESDQQLKNLLEGSVKVPLPTYFTLGDHVLPDVVQDQLESHGEVCTNLFYLGRKGTLKTTEGIRIVNLGGRLVQNEASLTQAIGKYDPLYTDADARGLHGAHAADILITNQWPANIIKNSQITVPDSIDPSSGSQSISNLCLALKPRYHFSSTPMAAWSREPFMVPAAVQGRQLKSYEELDGPIRFSSLASIETSNKECLSAFNLDPSTPPAKEGAQQTCPFPAASTTKRKREEGEEGNYRYSRDSHHDNRSRRNNRKHNKNFDPSNCFMCTSNDSFDSSMVVSIAEDSILTVLKGPLSLRGETFPQLSSSGHIMIIPMYHAADEAAHGKRALEDTQREFAEMTRYRQSLEQMLASKGLGSVCWEVNRTGIRHFHWQLIACPTDEIQSGVVEAAYKVAAENYKIKTRDDEGNQKETPIKFQPCDPDQLIPDLRSDFFRVWIWQPEPSHKEKVNGNDQDTAAPASNQTQTPENKLTPVEKADAISNGHDENNDTNNDNKPNTGLRQGTTKSMYFAIPAQMSFNISFGREVMAGILQLEKRSDWRTLESGNGLEEKDAQAWQEEYQAGGWDFAMA